MAITVESTSTQGYTSAQSDGSNSTITIGAPSGLSEDDLMVAVLTDAASGVSWTTKSGWSLAANREKSDAHVNVQYKVATATDAGQTDFTFENDLSGGSTEVAGVIFRLSGYAPSFVFDNATTDSTSSGSTTQTFSANLTPSYPDSFVIFGISLQDAASMSNYSTSETSGFTEVIDVTSSNTQAFAVAYDTQPSKNTITSFSADTSISTVGCAALCLFVSQADASGTLPLTTTTTTTTALDGSAGTNGTVNMQTTTTTTFNISGTAEQEIWSQQTKNSSNWNNQSKNSASWSNESKSSTNWTNQDKS